MENGASEFKTLQAKILAHQSSVKKTINISMCISIVCNSQ